MGLWSTQQVLAAGDPVSITPVNANFTAIAAILNGGIETINLADLAVSNAKLAADAVTTDKVQNGTLLGTDLNASAAIAGTQLANDAVTLNQLASLQVYANNRTTLNQIAQGASVSPWTFTYDPTMDGFLVIQGAISLQSSGAFRASVDVGDGTTVNKFGASGSVESSLAWASIPFFFVANFSANDASKTYTVTVTANYAAGTLDVTPSGFDSSIAAYVLPRA